MSCTSNNQVAFSDNEKCLINAHGSIMRVLVTDNPDDLVNLRLKSDILSESDIKSEELDRLKERMLSTVLDPLNTGVGIAAPQVGISKRVIAVKRFDKENEPFEFYCNPIIAEYSDIREAGREGCLSVPGRSEDVIRSQEIVIEYLDENRLEIVTEKISGFTAVIFQHEIDHLDGILYIDRVIY